MRTRSFRLVAPFLLALALVSVVSVAGVSDAAAARTWRRTDPVIVVDGQIADVFISSDLKMLVSATGCSGNLLRRRCLRRGGREADARREDAGSGSCRDHRWSPRDTALARASFAADREATLA
jgi:hypothetical protein